MKLYEILGIGAALLQILGYASYYRLAIKEEIRPNAASWLIWFYGNLIICVSYFFIGEFSLASLLPIVCAATNMVLVVALWKRGHFGTIDAYEKKIIVADISVTLLWLMLEFTTVGTVFTKMSPIAIPLFIHMLLMFSAIISFIPLFRETLSERCAEHLQPWLVWSSAYFVWLIAEVLVGKSWLLLYPFVYLLLHGAVAVILLFKGKRTVIC